MTRREEDSLGPVDVPDDVYYGAFTVRARDTFDLTGDTPPRELVRALGQVKLAAARTNRDLDLLDDETADAIEQAAREVIDGDFDDSFVIDTIQAGAGTPVHMNANEVIANRATELLGGEKGEYEVHPNDHVNMGQSSNNVVPTAVRLAALAKTDDLLAELDALADAFDERADAFDDVVKVGRTHLQDAVPVRLGQEFAAYASMVRERRDRIADAAENLRVVGLGGNAVGTGINTPDGFREALVSELAEVAGRDLEPADDPLATTRSMAVFTDLATALASFAGEGEQFGHDLMLLSSGPVAGLAEIHLPEVEPGSSIMPGKVNPSVVEAFVMSCLQADGHAHTVTRAAAMGDLELNVMTPVIGRNLLAALDVLERAVRMLREDCIADITADRDRIHDLFGRSTAVATALNPYLGYDRTAAVVKQAVSRDRRVRDLVVEKGWLTDEEADEVLDPERLTSPTGVDTDLQETVQQRLDGMEDD